MIVRVVVLVLLASVVAVPIPFESSSVRSPES